MASRHLAFKIALVGDVALDLLAPYFREAGYVVYVPAGFGTWRQELLDPNSALNRFHPDFVYDLTEAESALSKEVPNFYDERMRQLVSMPYSLDGIQALIEELEFICLGACSVRKVLAVDADNTLWRGIISEDGMDKVEPYQEFQKYLLSLRARGVLLVLLSKNDPFEFRADMALERGSFAAVGVNWGPKAGNLIEACRHLNVGTESVAFLDDNPFERGEMAASLPEVAVLPFPSDMTKCASLIRRLETFIFPHAAQTAEDKLRNQDYAFNTARESLARQAATVDDYLEALHLRVSTHLASAADLPRLVQMAGKTNQFNATTLRRNRGSFESILADPNKAIYTFDASDKFGKQGIVCYIIVDKAEKKITDFVMSCRAMGRTLEHFAYAYVCREIGAALAIDFVPTKKNRPFEEFLSSVRSQTLRPTHYKVEEVQNHGTAS